jgi:acyl carrier protein
VNDHDVLAGIAAVAREHLGYTGPLEPGMHLVEDLELDSIRRLTLAMEVENRFRVCLDEEDDLAVETVGDLVRAVSVKLAAAAEPSAAGGVPNTVRDASRPPS